MLMTIWLWCYPMSLPFLGWWMMVKKAINCIWLVGLEEMGSQRLWNYGNWDVGGIGLKLRECLKWCVGNSCRFVITIMITCIAFGIRGWSVFAATHGLRFCTTMLLEGLGIGYPHALLCLTNGVVASGGSLFFHTCMLWFDFFFPLLIELDAVVVKKVFFQCRCKCSVCIILQCSL